MSPRISLPPVDTDADREHDRAVQALIDAVAAERRSRPAQLNGEARTSPGPTQNTTEQENH